MIVARIRVGISGFSYDDWRRRFYPEGLRRRDELAYAAATFETIELNGTFYSLAEPARFRRWYDAAPRGFRYAVKGSRFITHNRKLADVDVALANFLASGILALRDKLGPILWQLPPTLRFDADRIDNFLSVLPRHTDEAGSIARRHDGRVSDPLVRPDRRRRLRHVLEPRHESWFNPEMVRIARRHGVAIAFSHGSAWPYTEEVTAGFVYLRLHGPAALYASSYGADGLACWASRIRAWHRASDPGDARRLTGRRPPRRRGRDVYVYFDNDVEARAPQEAECLRRLLASRAGR